MSTTCPSTIHKMLEIFGSVWIADGKPLIETLLPNGSSCWSFVALQGLASARNPARARHACPCRHEVLQCRRLISSSWRQMEAPLPRMLNPWRELTDER
jgi:hypothetical protein